MGDYDENMKSLRIKNLPSIIGEIRCKDEICAQLNDLTKVRISLDAKTEQVNAGFCQVNDVTSKLQENLVIIKRKVDDCVERTCDQQEFNAKCTSKIREYTDKSDKEKKELVMDISEWGLEITKLSKQFTHFADLYKRQNLEKGLELKIKEGKELASEVESLNGILDELEKMKSREEITENDSSCSHFLTSKGATDAVNFCKRPNAEEIYVLETHTKLLQRKKELQKWIEDNI